MYEQVINQFHNELWKHHRGPDRMVVGFTITTAISAHQHYNQCLSPLQLVPITTDVVSSNFDQGEVYNIMW